MTTKEHQAALDEIFQAKNSQPLRSVEDFACDGLFETDEELDEFLAYTYAARRAELGELLSRDEPPTPRWDQLADRMAVVGDRARLPLRKRVHDLLGSVTQVALGDLRL